MNIILELDEEGVNLQETILNLEQQGYGWYFHSWVEQIYREALWKTQYEIAIQLLKKHNLI